MLLLCLYQCGKKPTLNKKGLRPANVSSNFPLEIRKKPTLNKKGLRRFADRGGLVQAVKNQP
tara:strand:- start:394 stop:579 length:186 start_codon:yes stop_codon:yes gene_type:complete